MPVTISLRKCACCAESLDSAGEIVHFNCEAIPATRLWDCSTRHRLPAATGWVGRAEREAKVAASEHRKRRRRMHHFMEAEMLAIERNRRVHIMDNVSHLYRSQKRLQTTAMEQLFASDLSSSLH
jgi:hypothetical protein